MIDVVTVERLSQISNLPRREVRAAIERADVKVALCVDGVEYLDGVPARAAVEAFIATPTSEVDQTVIHHQEINTDAGAY